jgi:hypothetical protein
MQNINFITVLAESLDDLGNNVCNRSQNNTIQNISESIEDMEYDGPEDETAEFEEVLEGQWRIQTDDGRDAYGLWRWRYDHRIKFAAYVRSETLSNTPILAHLVDDSKHKDVESILPECHVYYNNLPDHIILNELLKDPKLWYGSNSGYWNGKTLKLLSDMSRSELLAAKQTKKSARTQNPPAIGTHLQWQIFEADL